nr:hypothetical protein Iba_chr12fCG1960 [Ipomoea batatas]
MHIYPDVKMMGVDSQQEDSLVGEMHQSEEDMPPPAGSQPEGEGVRRQEDSLPGCIQVKEEEDGDIRRQVGMPRQQEEDDEDIQVAADGDERRRGLPEGDGRRQIRQGNKDKIELAGNTRYNPKACTLLGCSRQDMHIYPDVKMMGVDSQQEDSLVGEMNHRAEDMPSPAGSQPEGEGVHWQEDSLPGCIKICLGASKASRPCRKNPSLSLEEYAMELSSCSHLIRNYLLVIGTVMDEQLDHVRTTRSEGNLTP